MTRHCMFPVLVFVVVYHLNHWCSRVLGDTVPGTSVAMMGKRNYKTAFCLTHIETNEIYLHCGEHGLVNLLGAYHGVQDIAMDDNPVCSFMESDECLRPITEIGPLRSKCMGQSECRFPVNIIYLEMCHQDSNYVQVEYECIPGNSADFGNIVDICGDTLQGRSVLREQGYIQSLDYPMHYPPDSMCTCNFTTTDEDAQIVFSTLDVDTFSPMYYERGDDWLEYTSDISYWGNGHVIDKEVHGSDIKTGSNVVNLNFRSDSVNEARGFWLKYKAVRESGHASTIKLSCGKYYPKGHRSSIVCLEKQQPKEEIYLNCNYLGVINILYAEHGYNKDIGPKTCAPLYQRTCTRNAMGHYKMFEKCMGQRDCNIVVVKETIPSCEHDSNYFQVEYQCIPDLNDPHHIVDVCGDKQENESVFNEVGYIESMNYPQPYSPDMECSCKLEVSEPETEIILTVLDMKMSDDSCMPDYVEYNRHTLDRGNGYRICDQVPKEPIHTDAKVVYLNTKTDSEHEERGFWIKYYGRKPDGSKSTVKVTCSGRRPSVVIDTHLADKTLLQPTNPPSGKTSTLPSVNGDQEVSVIELTQEKSAFKADDNITFGVMVGLGVVAVLVFAVLVGMIAYKYKRKNSFRKSRDESVIAVSAHNNGPNNSHLDTGYGSTFDNSYSTLQNDSCASSVEGANSIRSKSYSTKGLQYNSTANSPSRSDSGMSGINNPGYENYIPEPDYDDTPQSCHQNSVTKFDSDSKEGVSIHGKYMAASYKNPMFEALDDNGAYRGDCFYQI